MKRIVLFLAILALAVPAFGSGFDIEGGLGVDSIRISDYFELNGTVVDSIWASGDSLYFRVDGDTLGFPRVMSGSGLGDVVGPASAVNEDIAIFDGVTGKVIKDSGYKISDLGGGTGSTNADSLNHVLVTAPTPANGDLLKYNGTAWVNNSLADTASGAGRVGGYAPDFPVSLIPESLATKAPLIKPLFLDSLFMATGKPIMFGAVPMKDTLNSAIYIYNPAGGVAKNNYLILTVGDSVGLIARDSNASVAPNWGRLFYSSGSNKGWYFQSDGGNANLFGINSCYLNNTYASYIVSAGTGLRLRTTTLDSIWTASDSLKFYIGGVLYGFPRVAAGGTYTDEQAQDAVGGMATGSLAYVDATPSLQLSGDATSPGNSKLYGTNVSGTKGWYDQPSGAGVPATTVQGETTYGISSAVGTATSYAREDHTHGTPATTKDKTAITGILKGNGTDVSAATAGTDYENALTFSSPLSRAVNTISIPAATTSVNGYLTSTDWTTFNNKVATTRTISTTAPLTGGGDLSANRTFAIPAATTSASGYLTSTDWNTFNGKEAVITFNSPLSRTTNTVSLTTVGNTLGGTGQNSSAWSGIPKVTAGTWSVATASTDYVVPGDLAGYLYSAGAHTDGDLTVWEDGLGMAGIPATTYILATEKAAASGVASLSAASLVVQNPANATATPTASKIPIADGSGKLAAGWGGSASTLATLNASSLVVENPANATATATASKIPISDGSGKLDTWVSNASETVPGKVELATSAEINTGTDATRGISPDALAGSNTGKKTMQAYIIQATTAVSTGDGKGYMVIDSTLAGMNVIAIGASLIGAASSSGTPTIQIARGRQASATTAHAYNDVLTTRITIDALEWHSKDATTPPVINATYDDLLLGDLLRIDVDVAGTGAQGLIITVTGMLP